MSGFAGFLLGVGCTGLAVLIFAAGMWVGHRAAKIVPPKG